MSSLRDVYAQKALNQLPRLLSNLDRTPFSPTYGCFHRDYWLDKTSDFPDAVRQFAAHALALVYAHPMSGNIYYQQPKIRDWAVAALEFWASIQHRDGSFDEFYPYERGWVGPTAFTTFTSIETYQILRDDLPAERAQVIEAAIRRAAYFIGKGEAEEDHLANHHAMACLAVWKAYQLLVEPGLKKRFDALWRGFLSYHHQAEGWSREYDGIDPGYLSATVSFLAKIYQSNPDPAIRDVLAQSIGMSSYFVYPNGFYAGSLGSRNTLHFYPHGYEIMASEIPEAAAIAHAMLTGLSEDKLVPPEIISDRYVVYRVPEFLQAYLDYTERPETLPPLPYQRPPFTRYFPGARIFVANTQTQYTIANLAKGGVLKTFAQEDGQLVANDCGVLGQLQDGDLVTTQWVDPTFLCHADDQGWEVSGLLQKVPSQKLFTPLKQIAFRGALLMLGWSPPLAHWLKGRIRRTLILGQRPVGARFWRSFSLAEGTLTDEIKLLDAALQFQKLSVGDEFFVRYVPQSRYFQSQELNVAGYTLNTEELKTLNAQRSITIRRRVSKPTHIILESSKRKALPEGVYDLEYYAGRHKKRQLIYRLQRRTDEVEAALRTYAQGPIQMIVDIGTADSLMLEKLYEQFGVAQYIGLDYSFDLLRATQPVGISKTQADAQHLPLPLGCADAVIATAIIEHVPDPDQMTRECARILRPGGLLILTTPDPTMDKVASAIGLLKDTGHQHTFDLAGLNHLVASHNFDVLQSKKFMFSPVGFPAEKRIEHILGPLGLKMVMANQLVVARRSR